MVVNPAGALQFISWLVRRAACAIAVGLAIAGAHGSKAEAAENQYGVVFDSLLPGQSVSGCMVGAGCNFGTLQAIPFGGMVYQTFTFFVSSSNSDNYRVDGAIGASENSDGTSLPARMFLRITFLGSGSGNSVGEPDHFRFHYFLAWTGNGNNNILTAAAIGRYSAGVASNSILTVQANYGGNPQSAVLGPVSPPGSFSLTTDTFVSARNPLNVETIYDVQIRSGTTPGSYVEVGNMPAPAFFTAHDFNGDFRGDIAWRLNTGAVAIWLMNGAQVTSSGGLGSVPTTWSILGQRDFDGNGSYDLLWRDTSGNVAIWFMNGTQVASTGGVGFVPTTWSIVGTGDFNGDGKGDILWRDTAGNTAIWLMNGTQVASSGGFFVPATWSVVGVADFNGDGKSDILWRDTAGNTAIWLMNGAQISSSGSVGSVPTTWSVVGTGDFNGDGKGDILWRDTAGNTAIWLLNGTQVTSSGGFFVPTTWSVSLTGDYNGDGKSDILWRDTSGALAMWFMNGVQVASSSSPGAVPTVWVVQNVNAN